jgi:hypothetical protein
LLGRQRPSRATEDGSHVELEVELIRATGDLERVLRAEDAGDEALPSTVCGRLSSARDSLSIQTRSAERTPRGCHIPRRKHERVTRRRASCGRKKQG